MNEKRQEHWTVEPKQLVNPENVRLEKQRDQLEHLLSRLSVEVEAWKSHTNDEWSPSMDTSAVEREDAKEAAAYEENAENNTTVPFERMSAQIRKMAVQVEHIQHALEQSKSRPAVVVEALVAHQATQKYHHKNLLWHVEEARAVSYWSSWPDLQKKARVKEGRQLFTFVLVFLL